MKADLVEAIARAIRDFGPYAHREAHHWTDAASAAVAAIEAAGCAVVPIEPSHRQIAAGWDCLKRPHVRSIPTLGPGMGVKEAYQAMLRAAS